MRTRLTSLGAGGSIQQFTRPCQKAKRRIGGIQGLTQRDLVHTASIYQDRQYWKVNIMVGNHVATLDQTGATRAVMDAALILAEADKDTMWRGVGSKLGN